MPDFKRKDLWTFISGLLSFIFTAVVLFYALLFAPLEANLGESYRIIYVHVPAAATTFLVTTALFLISLFTVIWNKSSYIYLAKSLAECSLMFSILTLVTGSLWGKLTWGTYWTWDARLTTTLLLAVLLFGYQVLYSSITSTKQRAMFCAVLGILIFADVPIIYKSVSWWRTLHQPPSFLTRNFSISPEIGVVIGLCLVSMVLLAIWLVKERAQNLEILQQLESQSIEEFGA